jgi:hypothetical protein
LSDGDQRDPSSAKLFSLWSRFEEKEVLIAASRVLALLTSLFAPTCIAPDFGRRSVQQA